MSRRLGIAGLFIAASIAAPFACGGSPGIDIPPGSGGEGGSPLADAPSGSLEGSFVDTIGPTEDAPSDAPPDAPLDAPPDAPLDAPPDATGCNPDAGTPLRPRTCAPATDNECAGATDTFLDGHGVAATLANGSGGNGFDDDCDGLVDEGCSCPTNGTTKDCWLVPATQADPGTKSAVGWCAGNGKGSLDCAGGSAPHWSGTCRGGLPPYPDDLCTAGDFDCDGLAQNSKSVDCVCHPAPPVVTCPTDAIVEAPYPLPAQLALVDGSKWIDTLHRSSVSGWSWTLIGGDCDGVLPHPTFQIYKVSDSTSPGANSNAPQVAVAWNAAATPPRYVASPGSPLVGLRLSGFGDGVLGGQVYPAFGLSGEYILQGEFDLAGQHYACQQKIKVRAPGIHAELCWSKAQDADLDLHFARLQGATCATHGWDQLCPSSSTYQDCYFLGASGCLDTSPVPPGWGYDDSPNASCLGWSSKRRKGAQGCTNPRLETDLVSCDPQVTDPTDNAGGGFCGPENIDLDNPHDGDSFAIAVNYYGANTASATVKPHVNLYCNGERVLSAGYSPTSPVGFPLLAHPGTSSSGDWWNVATIKAHVGAGGTVTSCDVAPIPSHAADPNLDGSTQVCVESQSNASTPPYSYATHLFVENSTLQGGAVGSMPATPAAWCKH